MILKNGQGEATLLVLNMELTSKGMWVTTSSWKRPGNNVSPRASRKKCSSAGPLILVHETQVGLLTYRRVR